MNKTFPINYQLGSSAINKLNKQQDKTQHPLNQWEIRNTITAFLNSHWHNSETDNTFVGRQAAMTTTHFRNGLCSWSEIHTAPQRYASPLYASPNTLGQQIPKGRTRFALWPCHVDQIARCHFIRGCLSFEMPEKLVGLQQCNKRPMSCSLLISLSAFSVYQWSECPHIWTVYSSFFSSKPC